MELIMQECELQYLDDTYSQQINLEQTAELIVPDKCADGEAVVDAFGTFILRDSSYEGEELRISGTVQGGVLLLTQEGKLERVEAQIPISVSRQIPSGGKTESLHLCCRLTAVDGKLLNSRKVLLRASVTCAVRLYGQEQKILHSIEAPGAELQLKTAEYPVKLPVEQGSKTFTFSEEPELPEMAAPIARLLKTMCCPRILEQKTVGAKGVFKLEILLHILYEDPEERLCSFEWKIPLSQYVDFPRDVERGDLHTLIHLTDLDLEPDSRVQSRRLFLRLGLQAQCMVYAVRELRVIEDAFCTDAMLQPKWQQWQCQSLLDSRELSAEARWHTEEGIASVVDVWVQPMEAELQHREDVMQIKLPLSCTMIYYDTQGQLRGKEIYMSGETELPLHAGATAQMGELNCGQVYYNAGPAGAELRIPVQFRVNSFGTQAVRDLQEACICELPLSMERRPSVILRRTEGEESLWDLAKSYNSTVEGIRMANDLDSDNIPADTLLLIPL